MSETLKFRGGQRYGVDLCFQHAELVDICNTIAARHDAGIVNHKYEHTGVLEMIKVSRLGGLYDQGENKHQMGSVWDKNGIAPTIDTMTGGLREPMVVEESKVLGGLSDVKSNNGTQYYQQDRVYSMGDICPCIPNSLSSGSYHFLEEKFFAVDEQNMIIRSDTIGTLTTDGNSPKHNNRVAECQQIKIKQATEQGFAMCDIGGGGGLELHRKPNKARKSNRERKDLSDNNNGEYP